MLTPSLSLFGSIKPLAATSTVSSPLLLDAPAGISRMPNRLTPEPKLANTVQAPDAKVTFWIVPPEVTYADDPSALRSMLETCDMPQLVASEMGGPATPLGFSLTMFGLPLLAFRMNMSPPLSRAM